MVARFDRNAAVFPTIAEQTDAPGSDLKWTSRLDSDLGLNSFDVLELIASIPQLHLISIPDEVVERLETVFDVVSCLHSVDSREVALGIDGSFDR